MKHGAVEVLTRKKNIRVLVASEPLVGGIEFKQISGGLLLQQRDAIDAPTATTRPTGRLARRSARRPGHAGRPEVRLAELAAR